MPYCFVPSCQRKYHKGPQSNGEIRRFFKVPKDKVEDWGKRISRKDKELSTKCHICDLHFDERFILKTFSHIINGETVHVDRGNWKLTPDAFPTKFPTLPSYFTKSLPKIRTSPEKRKAIALEQMNEKTRKPRLSDFICIDPTLNSGSCSAEMAGGSVECCQHLNPPPPEFQVSNSRPKASPELLIAREKVYRLTANMRRHKKRISVLLVERKNLSEKVKKLQRQLELQERQNSCLPSRQKLMVEQMKIAAKCKTGNGIRYDSEWLQECISIRLRSPEMYEFLRTNKYMPLPCRMTLQKYISGLNAESGFDSHVFEQLEDNLACMPEEEQTESLMCDELSLETHVECKKEQTESLMCDELQDELSLETPC